MQPPVACRHAASGGGGTVVVVASRGAVGLAGLWLNQKAACKARVRPCPCTPQVPGRAAGALSDCVVQLWAVVLLQLEHSAPLVDLALGAASPPQGARVLHMSTWLRVSKGEEDYAMGHRTGGWVGPWSQHFVVTWPASLSCTRSWHACLCILDQVLPAPQAQWGCQGVWQHNVEVCGIGRRRQG